MFQKLATAAAGAAAAATAAPATVHCRAPANHFRGEPSKLTHSKQASESASSTTQPASALDQKVDPEWLLTEIEDGRVHFTAEEITETVHELCNAQESAYPLRLASQDSSSEDECSIETFDVNSKIEAAELSGAAVTTLVVPDLRQNLASVATRILSNDKLVGEVARYLKSDPEFQAMLHATGWRHHEELRGPVTYTVEEVDDDQEQADPGATPPGRSSPLEALVQAFTEGLKKVGSAVLAAQEFFHALAKRFHARMMQSMDTLHEGKVQEPEFWTEAGLVVSVAVLAVMVFKRVPIMPVPA